MSELEILGLVGASVLTAGVTYLFALMRINKMNAPTPTVQLETVDSAHVHEATTMNAAGWHCDCGKHLHSFSTAGRCICGAEGEGKVWA